MVHSFDLGGGGPDKIYVTLEGQKVTGGSDSGSSLRRREIFPLINYAGSGHANLLRFEQSRCILVRRTIYCWDAQCLYSPLVIVGDSW